MRWWVWAVAGGAVAVLLSRAHARAQRPHEAITAVVLGSSDHDRQEYRVNGLIRLLSVQPVFRVIMSGRGEAPRMAEILANKMPSHPPVIIENESTNTETNILRVAELLEPDEEVVLISDHHHLRGAGHCLQKMGWKVWTYQVPEPHQGYAADAGYDIYVNPRRLPEPRLTPAPAQCESGFYFWCC